MSGAGELNPNWRGGKSSHPLYWIYGDILARCSRSTHHSWANYGGRGIQVCVRWREDFWNFVADMGERPGDKNAGRAVMSIDRINNDGDYEPGNCHWATYSQQANNKRSFGWLETLDQHGELNHMAKLTWPQVHEIRSRYSAGGCTHKSLSIEYAVCEGTVQQIVEGRTWKEQAVV